MTKINLEERPAWFYAAGGFATVLLAFFVVAPLLGVVLAHLVVWYLRLLGITY